jgi:DNA-binding NarL/FixJ family response regulator
LTSSHDQEDLLRQFELDATGYLMKPIGKHQLLSRLAEVVDGERLTSSEHWKNTTGWVPDLGERHGRRDASRQMRA